MINKLISTAVLASMFVVSSSLIQATVQEETNNPAIETRVRYAHALLDLANIELREALETSIEVPGSIDQITLERLRQAITFAKDYVESVESRVDDSPILAQQRSAEVQAKVALMNYEKIQQARDLHPASVTEFQVEKMRLRAEVGKLRVQMWNDPVNHPTMIEQMQWQIDRMNEEITELHRRIDHLKR